MAPPDLAYPSPEPSTTSGKLQNSGLASTSLRSGGVETVEVSIFDLALDVSFFLAGRVGDVFVVEDVHGSHAALSRREPGLVFFEPMRGAR